MSDIIKIDGMRGEGGGQILRTSLALSAITGKAFKMANIRSRRKKPGLLRQHLTAVNAAAQISCAEVEGNEINSKSLSFRPGCVVSGEYHFRIGSAGSATLVLQTVLPPLLFAEGRSKVVIEGGTHNMMAPPYDFLEKSFLPVLKSQGARVDLKLSSWGFYPAGGGRIEVEIEAVKALSSFKLEERGGLKKKLCRSIVSALPVDICERELRQVKKKLNWTDAELVSEKVPRPVGPGNIMLFELEYENTREVIASFGDRGVAAEKVAKSGVDRVKSFLTSQAVVGEYLADQLLIPMALAGAGSFTCTTLSSHTLTNISVIQDFLDVEFETEKLSSDNYRISIK